MSAVEELLQAEVKREEEAEERREARRAAAPRTPQHAERQPSGVAGAGLAERAESADEMNESADEPPELDPLPPLRRLTLDDFLRARAVVRPTRGRFEGVDHGLGTGLPPAPAEYDESLYD